MRKGEKTRITARKKGTVPLGKILKKWGSSWGEKVTTSNFLGRTEDVFFT